MTIEGIEYKTIEGKVIPNKGKFEAVLDSLIFPTSQGKIVIMKYFYYKFFFFFFFFYLIYFFFFK